MTAPTTEAPESGAEEMTLDQLLEQIREVSDDHVAEGLKAVQGRAAEIRNKHAAGQGLSEDERKEAKALKDAWARLDAEKTSRAEQMAELEADLEGIPGVDDTAEQTEEKPAESEAPAEDAKDEPAADEKADDTKESKGSKGGDGEKGESATSRLKLGAITGKREPAEVTGQREEPRVSIVAAAGDRSFTRGQEMSPQELYSAIWERQRRINHDQGGSGDYITVASIEHPTRDDRHLSSHDEFGNSRKVDAVTQPQALTAAGVCAPYTIDYSMGVIGSTARPVKAAFPNYTADRGGVQFRRDVDALGSGPISASGTWSLETDANPGDPTAGGSTKPIWDVPCNDVISAEVQAVTLGLRFSNITNRFDPEAVAANTQAAAIAHARQAEMLLLNSMYSQCTATFQETKTISATRDLLVAIDKVRAYWRDARRIGDDVPLRTILPHWVLDAMRADLTRAMHTANEAWLGEADTTILQWFNNRGITPSWTLDGRAAITAASGPPQVYGMAQQGYGVLTGPNAIPAFPAQVEFAMFPEGTFVYLDGGSLDVGVVRDQALVQQNRYIQFSETFEGLYRKGIEAVRVVADVVPTGGSAGTVDTHTFTS